MPFVFRRPFAHRLFGHSDPPVQNAPSSDSVFAMRNAHILLADRTWNISCRKVVIWTLSSWQGIGKRESLSPDHSLKLFVRTRRDEELTESLSTKSGCSDFVRIHHRCFQVPYNLISNLSGVFSTEQAMQMTTGENQVICGSCSRFDLEFFLGLAQCHDAAGYF